MKKHLLITAIVMALVMCLSFGALAADDDSGYVNDYTVSDAIKNVSTNDNVTILTVGTWRAENGITDTSKTFFENGEALNDDDIIITNGKVAVVLAVGTRNPWGYPSGSVLDAGTVKQDSTLKYKEGYRDTTWSIEFLPDWWDSWSPNNCGVVAFDIVKYDFTNKVESDNGIPAVKVTRVYDLDGLYSDAGNNDKKFDVVTYYSTDADSKYVYMFDSLNNTSGEDIYYAADGEGGQYEEVAWAVTNKGDDGSAMFNFLNRRAVGSYGDSHSNPRYSDIDTVFTTALVIPDESFTSNLGNEFAITGSYGKSGYQEMYVKNTSTQCATDGYTLMFKKDEKVTFGEYIVISDKADHSVMNDFINEKQDIDTYAVSGTVQGVENPIVIVKDENGETYGWYVGDKDGKYSINLPNGNYSLTVEKNGYMPSEAVNVEVNGAAVADKDLTLGAKKVKFTFNLKDQDGNPIWGKVQLFDADGNSLYPTVRYAGESVYNASEKGKVTVDVPEGKFQAIVYGEGYWFYSAPTDKVEYTAKDGGSVDVKVDILFENADGWYSGDMHHHTNKNDAFALPSDVIQSQLASNLDIVFTTDHDFTTNNYEAYQYIQEVNATSTEIIGYVPSEEISCSWAHFNIVPLTVDAYDYYLDENAENHVENQFANLGYFIKSANEKGASVTANHPTYSYGLFTALGKDAIPGGYVDTYDLLELNSSSRDNENGDAINGATALWTAYLTGEKAYIEGKEVTAERPHYINGGSDTHDVLTPKLSNLVRDDREQFFSGKYRTIAYTGDLSDATLQEAGLAFGEAAVNGNSYVTSGPLLDLDQVPGEGTVYKGDEYITFSFDVNSLVDIKDIVVLSSEGYKEYSHTYGGKRTLTLENVVYVIDNVDDDVFSESLTIPLYKGEESWYAIMVVDANGNFALTNPYWVEQTKRLYTDTSHWAIDAINFLSDMGAITGYPDGTFLPDNNITRAEFAAMVSRFLDFDVVEDYEDVSFSDVKEGSWYYDYVMELAQAGILDGYPAGDFKPNAMIARSEISKIMAELAGWDEEYKVGDELAFSDIDGKWFTTYVQYLADGDLVDGYGDGTFRPLNNATRAESAQFLYNFCKWGVFETHATTILD